MHCLMIIDLKENKKYFKYLKKNYMFFYFLQLFVIFL